MELKSNVSKYLVVCCVSMLLVQTMAKGMEVTKGRCNETLIIPSDFYKIPTEKSEGNGNINTRSLSPWTWKITTVENRIPQTMWEAECSSMYCVYPTNSSQYMRYGQNSVPIYQQVVVLYTSATRKCYSASFLSVAVGCTCAWARTT